VTLRARTVTRISRWVTLRARWVTLRARWVTLRARWVPGAAGEPVPLGAGKALLRMAIWAHSTGLKEKSEAIQMFQAAIDGAGSAASGQGTSREKAHFHFARCVCVSFHSNRLEPS
jgi:hypothetical protein